ncbi:MAG: hypothetical protein ABI867_28900 [Kofleriaceae bacterium]
MGDCELCDTKPTGRCGRCGVTYCTAHALAAGTRCERCEHDYTDEATTRRAAKLIFVPPISILVGGILFGLLLPVSLGGALGAVIMCAVACTTAVGVGVGACRIVDRNARALFLRERSGGLPPARLLPSPRHR